MKAGKFCGGWYFQKWQTLFKIWSRIHGRLHFVVLGQFKGRVKPGEVLVEGVERLKIGIKNRESHDLLPSQKIQRAKRIVLNS